MGTAQKLLNRRGWDVGKRVLILGTGDLGQIVARKMVQAGKLVSMLEQQDRPGGLARNRRSCLEALHIPALRRSTVDEILGEGRISGVMVRHQDVLSLEEIEEAVRAAVGLRCGKSDLPAGDSASAGFCGEFWRLRSWPLTTNGLLLPDMAVDLKAAGVDRVNISLDTLNPEKYRTITRGGDLSRALAGIQAAKDADLLPLQISRVLVGGFDDNEIPALAALTLEEPVEVRFIELMPIGDTAGFGPEAYLPCEMVLKRLPQLKPAGTGGVAERFRLPGAAGLVGLIRPLSRCFCDKCDHLRLTADGCLKPCLHTQEELSLQCVSMERTWFCSWSGRSAISRSAMGGSPPSLGPNPCGI